MNKNQGQIFTPTPTASLILDTVGYYGIPTLTHTIMEPSFGKGAFLIEIATRIIEAGREQGWDSTQIAKAIDDNVYGIEKDLTLYEEAISTLNHFLASQGIPAIEWTHLGCGDTLLVYTYYAAKMDFVVGNPPYVSTHNLDTETRMLVKSFNHTEGTTNLYVPFYMAGLTMLTHKGKLCYITPNSIFTNVAQRGFRRWLCEEGLVRSIYDFRHTKLFAPHADVYTCIIALDRMEKQGVEYRGYEGDVVKDAYTIPYEEWMRMGVGEWRFGSYDDMQFLAKVRNRKRKLSDFVRIQNGCATNRDSVYVGKAYYDADETKPYNNPVEGITVYFNGYPVESGCLRRCVKGADAAMPQFLLPTLSQPPTNQYILYPYENGKPLDQNAFFRKFPLAYNYLLAHIDVLTARSMDGNTDWFLFARSQGISTMDNPKIVLPLIHGGNISNKVAGLYGADVVVYSGLYMTALPDSPPIPSILPILNTSDFSRYLLLTGKPIAGGFVSLSARTVGEYGVPDGVL